jgi:Na+-driven multidrug efflux pump
MPYHEIAEAPTFHPRWRAEIKATVLLALPIIFGGYFGANIFCESLNRPLAPMWFLFGGVMLNLILALTLVFG